MHLHMSFAACCLKVTCHVICHNPTFGKVKGWHSHSRNGDLGVHRDSQNFRVQLQGQNTLQRGVIYIIGKLSKCRCRKCVCMSHLDISSTSYDKKKGQESNWQFDSRPLKVGNRLDPGVCRGSATHRWKSLDKSYKFTSNLIPIGSLSKELWPRKVAKIQIETISGLLLGSPRIKKTI
jgi:hypothetical protein